MSVFFQELMVRDYGRHGDPRVKTSHFLPKIMSTGPKLVIGHIRTTSNSFWQKLQTNKKIEKIA